MKFNNLFISALMLGGIILPLSSCSDDDDPTPVPPSGADAAVNLTLTDNGFENARGTNFEPGFTAGSKAGLFAVKDGAVVASNIDLTFDGNTWKSTATVPSDCDHYYIYTPFKTDAAAKITVSATDAAQFFAGLISAYATPGNDQGNFDEAVRPYDVTYASATAAPGDGNLNLTATATHALAVASWILPGGTRYTTSDGFSYSTPGGSIAGDVTAGDATVTPCNINGNPAYFYLPGNNGKINVAYTSGGTDKSIDIDLDATSGTLAETAIEGGSVNGGQRDLKIGDIYYRDGSILPVEALEELTEAPAGVAGIVFCVDPSRFSADETALLGKVHALVISAKMGCFKNTREYFAWCDAYPQPGDDQSGRYFDHVEDPDYPGLMLPLIQDREDPLKSYQVNNSDINGYKYNQIIRQRRSQDIASNYYPSFAAIDNLNSTVGISAGNTTGWYLPAVGHLLDFMRNIGGADTSESLVAQLPTDTEKSGFYFGENASPALIANLDKAMEKISADEKSLYADSRFALWTSSYGTRYYQATDSDIPAVRQVVFQNDMLFVFSYDIIGKGNVRGILAF